MAIDRKFLLCGFAYAIAGMGLGIYMAASKNHALFIAHAHILLVGFVLSFIYALVLTPAVNVVPGAVIRARPIGVLLMEDESGTDEKLICVPHDKIHPQFSKVFAVEDLPDITRQSIEHFFSNYKGLEPGKWVKVSGWADRAAAEEVIRRAILAAG